ncbi:c-type cytochrome [Szabonella alba]|uniref:Cytochrome C n=1 Tax=Szabonella alba TaxID=2804194 RepID=A0A8K0VEI4_9RHOB|nr:cytochrome C [Szabonella alba]MBL4917620.1 cytochrome C [Szabonella alba]
MSRALVISCVVLSALGAPLHAGDPVAGEREFGKCRSCHAVVAPDGTEIVKGGRTGPNLYGVVGRAVGSTDFRYGASMASLSGSGLVWTEAEIDTYIVDPQAWIAAKTGDSAAKSSMTFRLRKGGADVAAYLASVAR